MHTSGKPGCLTFAVKVILRLPLRRSWNLWEITFLRLPSLTCSIHTGEALHEAAVMKKSTAGGLDGWAWTEVTALSLSWFVGPALVLRQIESLGPWPQGLLDAYIAIIPKAEVDATPLGHRPLCVFPVVYRIWASVRSVCIQGLVLLLGIGPGLQCWQRRVLRGCLVLSTTIDFQEVLSNTSQGYFHICVADVLQSFDTVDRDILDCALGRLGLPDWFRRVNFACQRDVRLLFKLATRLGVSCH